MKKSPPIDEWRAKDDANTLMHAEEVKGDKARHGAAMAHVKKTVTRAQSVMGKPKPTSRRK